MSLQAVLGRVSFRRDVPWANISMTGTFGHNFNTITGVSSGFSFDVAPEFKQEDKTIQLENKLIEFSSKFEQMEKRYLELEEKVKEIEESHWYLEGKKHYEELIKK